VEFIEQLAVQPSEGSIAVQQLEKPKNRGKGRPWKKAKIFRGKKATFFKYYF